ncbi:MAG: hypothetical protein Q9188_005061, partial [Gyalolechia gomerana]
SPSLDLWRDDDDFPPPPPPGNISNAKRPLPPSSPSSLQPNKRAKHNHDHTSTQLGNTWSVHRAQWRLRVQPRPSLADHDDSEGDGRSNLEIEMVAVKLEATSGEKARNAQRGWLD